VDRVRASLVRRSAAASRGAFTLTELLIVIAIIAVLAALSTAAAIGALRRSKQSQIQLEIETLQAALEEFHQKYNAYPPTLTRNTLPPIVLTKHPLGHSFQPTDIERLFKIAFPKHRERKEVLRAMAGTPYSVTLPGQKHVLASGMNADEALVFWLRGFSDDAVYPLSGAGGPSFTDADGDGDGRLEASDERLENRKRLFDFDLERLGPRTADGALDDAAFEAGNAAVGRYLLYEDPRNGQVRRINLWNYHPKSSSEPYVYFDVSRHEPTDLFESGSGALGKLYTVHPVTKLREGATTLADKNIVFVNSGKFQIMHPGLDGAWGDFSPFRSVELAWPAGPFIGEMADTLSNFGDGRFDEDMP